MRLESFERGYYPHVNSPKVRFVQQLAGGLSMRRFSAVSLLVVLVFAGSADAARRRVVVRGPHRTVVVHTGFPVHRVLPAVVVRPGPVVRVAPRLYLAPVVFAATVIAL